MKTSPTPYASDLLVAIEQGMPLAAVRRMCALLESNKLWKPADPVDDKGRLLLSAWLDATRMNAHRSGNNNITAIDDETMTWLFAVTPAEKCWVRSYHGEPLDQAILKTAMDGMYSYSPLWSPVLWSQIPEKTLKEFRGKHGESRSVQGEAILREVLQSYRPELTEVLLARGWSWNSTSACPPAASIGTVADWELFLGGGGDPLQVVNHKNHQTDKPLRSPIWKYLLENGRFKKEEDQALKETLRAWARANVGDSLAQKEMQDYWTNVDRYGGGADVIKRIRANKEWPTLRNAQGETPLMVGLRRADNLLDQIASTAKAIPALTPVDKNGWSLWHHLISRGKNVSALSFSLAQKHANPLPDPKEGILPLLVKSGKFSEHEFGFSDKYCPPAEAWWGGSIAAQDRLGRYLMSDDHYLGSKSTQNSAFFDTAHFCKELAKLIRLRPLPDDATPLLKGALAINELMTTSYRGGEDRLAIFHTLMNAGARVEMSKKFEKSLSDAVASNENFRALVLNSKLSETPSAPARPRM